LRFRIRGTTEEEAGFDEESTLAARDEIGAALLRMLPAMADAQIAQQTACLRPVASDGLLVLGCVPGLDHVYVATGGARKGILYGPAMGQAIADLVLGRDTRVALDAFTPGRFGAREVPRRGERRHRHGTTEQEDGRLLVGLELLDRLIRPEWHRRDRHAERFRSLARDGRD
jgi:glycine/D-amino acid oxidase-like deaminating enzyme